MSKVSSVSCGALPWSWTDLDFSVNTAVWDAGKAPHLCEPRLPYETRGPEMGWGQPCHLCVCVL